MRRTSVNHLTAMFYICSCEVWLLNNGTACVAAVTFDDQSKYMPALLTDEPSPVASESMPSSADSVNFFFYKCFSTCRNHAWSRKRATRKHQFFMCEIQDNFPPDFQFVTWDAWRRHHIKNPCLSTVQVVLRRKRKCGRRWTGWPSVYDEKRWKVFRMWRLL